MNVAVQIAISHPYCNDLYQRRQLDKAVTAVRFVEIRDNVAANFTRQAHPGAHDCEPNISQVRSGRDRIVSQFRDPTRDLVLMYSRFQMSD